MKTSPGFLVAILLFSCVSVYGQDVDIGKDKPKTNLEWAEAALAQPAKDKQTQDNAPAAPADPLPSRVAPGIRPSSHAQIERLCNEARLKLSTLDIMNDLPLLQSAFAESFQDISEDDHEKVTDYYGQQFSTAYLCGILAAYDHNAWLAERYMSGMQTNANALKDWTREIDRRGYNAMLAKHNELVDKYNETRNRRPAIIRERPYPVYLPAPRPEPPPPTRCTSREALGTVYATCQ